MQCMLFFSQAFPVIHAVSQVSFTRKIWCSCRSSSRPVWTFTR
jgi:hypothetical protein